MTVPTNAGGSVSSNAYTGTVYDQYGVSWYQDPTFSCNYTDKVSMDGNKLVVTNKNSNASSDYTVTVTAKCGDASATKTCKINTWNYQATFYNEDGKTVLKPTQSVVYGNSAAKPNDPTKAYDSTNHYTFRTWEPTVGPLTSGAQKVDYIAKYDANPHSYNSEVVQEATCTEKGTKKYTCDCGYSYTEDIPATGHNFTDKDTSETFLKSAATCTEAAVYYNKCANCGISSKGIDETKIYSSGNPLGHDFSNETVEERYLKSEATCLNKAVYYKSCSRCGEKGTDTFETGNALGHSFTEKSMTAEYLKSAAACTAPAEYYFKCSRCSEKGTETYTVGEKLGHSFTQQEMTDAYLKTAATCESNAVYYYKCSRCSEKGTDTYEKPGSALGHDWDDGVITTSPTCEGAGVKTFHCKRDNSHTKTEAVSATGHSWNEDYTVDIPATCTTDGQKSIHCKTSGCDAIKPGSEVVIAALDHDWGNWEITLKETCTTPGSEKRVCKRDNNHVETRERKALGHNFNVEDISDDFLKTPADCTNAAVYYYKCANCGVSSEGIDETKTYSYGNPLGHTPGAEATCTTNQICTVCKAELHPALGHDWETE
ncbi:MAG: hypothetical protein Q4D20_10010, partial [Clostridia bacterium]|nr:hypothetical protein [Clostridia bacterium]